MKNRNTEVRFETFDKPTSNKFLEELKAKQKENSAYKADCSTENCKRLTPKFRLSLCNVKTIIMLGIIIYLWLAN